MSHRSLYATNRFQTLAVRKRGRKRVDGKGITIQPSMPIEFTAHVIKKTGAESKVDFLKIYFSEIIMAK